MEISSQESDIQLADNDRLVSVLTQYAKDQLTDILQYKSLIWGVFDLQHTDFIVKKPNESEILSGHFKWIPIAPGIMMKLLLLSITRNEEININHTSSYIRTIFPQSAVPGSKITLWEDGMSLIDEKENEYVRIGYVNRMNTVEPEVYEEWFQTIQNTDTPKIEKFSEQELDKYLLQSGTFRFADSATFIRQKEENEVNEGDIFSWSYQLSSSDICFSDTHENTEKMYHGFFEEIAAQIGSLAMGKILWEVNAKDSKILTFKESIFKYDWKVLGERVDTHSVINVTWIVVKKEKRSISFIFIWKNDKWEELFRWEISGNVMSATILKKMSKKGE